MITRNAYLGLLLIALASSSSVFAARDGHTTPVRGARRRGLMGWLCCMSATQGLQHVAETLESGEPVSLEMLIGSFLAGFSDAMWMDTLTRSGVDEGSGTGAGAAAGAGIGASAIDINPILYDKLMTDIIAILTHHKIRTTDINAYLAENGNPAANSVAENKALATLQAERAPRVETCLATYAANLATSEATSDKLPAISIVLLQISQTEASDTAPWVTAEPFIKAIAGQLARNLTLLPAEAHAAWTEASNRSLVSLHRSASHATINHSASARSVASSAPDGGSAAPGSVEVRIDDPAVPVAPKAGWRCCGRKPKL